MQNKIVKYLMLLVVGSFASLPMESSRRTLTVFHHGINEDSNGVAFAHGSLKNCHQYRGVGFNTFNQKGTLGYMADSVIGSLHLVYNQSASHPGMGSPHLKLGFGYRDYDPSTDIFNFTKNIVSAPLDKPHTTEFWSKNQLFKAHREVHSMSLPNMLI